MADDPLRLPLTDDQQVAIIQYGGVSKAYPLDYVIHHHIVNDRFGDRIVALTFCPMCRSIIPFDVSDIGPLFVGSFKGSNMIVADRRTKTFFQQATFDSIVGRLHPHTLTMIPFQILAWSELKTMKSMPQVAGVKESDFKEFELPIPGLWRRIMASDVTPGMAKRKRDKTFPPRTHVVGITDPIAIPQVVYLKDELLQHGIVRNTKLDVVLVAVNNSVNAFRGSIDGRSLDLTLNRDHTLGDRSSGTLWNLRGQHISGQIAADLTPVAVSDEYWFAWKAFHPSSRLIRV